MLTRIPQKQRTLGGEFAMTDVALHTGQRTTLRCRPAADDHGIVFHRVDVAPDALIPARLDQVRRDALQRRTTLGAARGGATVATCEHLLSAFYGCGVDNALVELEGDELPFFDGSAAAFVEQIDEVGVVEQAGDRTVLRLERPVVFDQKGVEIVYVPSDTFSVSVFVDYGVELVGAQAFDFADGGDYAREVAPARTFVMLEEIQALRAGGLIAGGSLDNAIVITAEGYLNDSLRFPDEIVRHKTLDLLGDLMLLGHRLRGHVSANRAGHASHLAFAQLLLDRNAHESAAHAPHHGSGRRRR